MMPETGTHCGITEEFPAFLRHPVFQDEAHASVSDHLCLFLISNVQPRLFRDFLSPCCSDCCTEFLQYCTLASGFILELAPVALCRDLGVRCSSVDHFGRGMWQHGCCVVCSASKNSLMTLPWCS